CARLGLSTGFAYW
nr:immunoglobulin heavy chain junction region [Mus musculus]NSM09649.1 immunoglobulin heavy chain junction region [Mus musculus]